MVEMSRQRGGRRLVSTYPQMQAGAGGTTDAAVMLPPPYCDVVDDGPPPYSAVAGNKPDPQSHEVESLRQSDRDSDPSDSLLNEPV